MPESVLKKIEEEMIVAMKGKKEVELSTLRMMKTAIKNAEIAKRPEKLTEDDEMKVLKSEVKKHQDSIDLFQGSRPRNYILQWDFVFRRQTGKAV